MLFHGCNYEPALGKTPFGRLDISSVETQHAIRDSDQFELEIYKDKELTKLIAVLAPGVIISTDELQPGTLSDVSILPEDLRV